VCFGWAHPPALPTIVRAHTVHSSPTPHQRLILERIAGRGRPSWCDLSRTRRHPSCSRLSSSSPPRSWSSAARCAHSRAASRRSVPEMPLAPRGSPMIQLGPVGAGQGLGVGDRRAPHLLSGHRAPLRRSRGRRIPVSANTATQRGDNRESLASARGETGSIACLVSLRTPASRTTRRP